MLAEAIAEMGVPADAISRTYYAMLHAANAVLLELGIERGSHHGVWAAFGEHVTARGLMDARHPGESIADRLSLPPEWLNVAQSGSIAVCRFSPFRLSVAQCGSTVHAHTSGCGGGAPLKMITCSGLRILGPATSSW
jgi:hypothetical protein